jgi:GNAT superfamily N-acetyltransferase
MPQTLPHAAGAIDLDTAIDVFAGGFAFSRAFTHPCQVERVGKLWAIRDGPRKRVADYRREEWLASHVSPAEVDAAARNGARGRYCVCVICAAGESDIQLRAAYKALGYRLGTTEPFMVHRLKRIPRPPEPIPVSLVTTQDLADRVAKAAGRRQMLPEHLIPGSPLRLYAALDGQQPIGWLKSVTVGESTWVANVYVVPKHRRRGIGKSMLARMLRDDRRLGSKQSVLLASHVGALLYPNVGYELIGRLLLFTPRRR